MSRIGIYAGTFDPVHAGHVAFALQSLEATKLDKVYFLPERQPRAKQQVEHFGHRVGMLNKALKPYNQLEVMELVDINFSVARTLPYLKQQFPGDDLVFLFGSDVVTGLIEWPNIDRLLRDGEIVIGLRSQNDRQEMHAIVEAWPVQPKKVTIFDSYAPAVSSGQVRDALRRREATAGMLKSVETYSNHNWLYVSVA